MLLSDQGILQKIDDGSIVLNDPDGRPVLGNNHGEVEAHGYDLKIDAFYSWKHGGELIQLKEKRCVILEPGEHVIVQSYERVQLDRTIAATVHSLARRTQLGLVTFPTTIHPGWGQGPEGPQPLSILVANISRSGVELRYRDRFCRLLFFEVSPEASTPVPDLHQVQAELKEAIAKQAPEYSRKRKQQGWGCVITIVVFAVIILYIAFLINDSLLALATPIVVLLLTLILELIKKKFHIID
jgi:deoxycytidine triphosphate deaminase